MKMIQRGALTIFLAAILGSLIKIILILRPGEFTASDKIAIVVFIIVWGLLIFAPWKE